jgi:hypothetical protein
MKDETRQKQIRADQEPTAGALVVERNVCRQVVQIILFAASF